MLIQSFPFIPHSFHHCPDDHSICSHSLPHISLPGWNWILHLLRSVLYFLTVMIAIPKRNAALPQQSAPQQCTHLCIWLSPPVCGREQRSKNLHYKWGSKDLAPSKEPWEQHHVTPLAKLVSFFICSFICFIGTGLLGTSLWNSLIYLTSSFSLDCSFPSPSTISLMPQLLIPAFRAFKIYSPSHILLFPSSYTRLHSR